MLTAGGASQPTGSRDWNCTERPRSSDLDEAADCDCAHANVAGLADAAAPTTALQPKRPPGDQADCDVAAVDDDRGNVDGRHGGRPPLQPLPRTGRYGFRAFAPDWLQRLNAPGPFLAFLCWFTFIQSFPVNGLMNVNTTTLERRFRLTSAQVGFISSMYDIVGGLVVLPISYYGGRGHKPRYLAVASLFILAGSLVMLLPHVLAGAYDYPSAAGAAASGQACGRGGNGRNATAALLGGGGGGGSSCAADEAAGGAVSGFFYLFLFGMGLMGCGGITLYTVGTVFIDENLPADRASVFTGIFFGFTSLGSAAGFLAGSRFLAVYVDTPARPPTDLTQEDPQWVGAWWMGYVVNMALAAFLSIFLFGFPRELPSADEARQTRISEAHHQDTEVHNRAIADPTFGTRIRDVPAATALLLRNPAFMCITMAGITDSLVKSGIAQFLAKFIQNQFNQTASWSAMLAGFIVVPGAAGGCVAGGWLQRRLRLKVPGLISLCLISSFSVTALSAGFWMHCDVDIMAGVTAAYSDADPTAPLSLTSPCNRRCGCDTSAYAPVCGSDGLQYFSSCHGGCSGGSSAGSLHNCSCVGVAVTASVSVTAAAAAAAAVGGDAVAGKCQVHCPLLYAFLCVILLAILAVFLTLTPWTTMSMRIVAESQRTYAVGFQWVFLRLAGLAPGPVMFGAIIDAACVVWQDRCGMKGSCWLYRGRALSVNVFAAIVGLKLVSFALYACAYKLYRPPPDRKSADEAAAADEYFDGTQAVSGSVVPLTSAAANGSGFGVDC